jgi:hypothetical protein
MINPAKCEDCSETEELAACSICGKHVCGAHRSGTGRRIDGYQCSQRGCQVVQAQRVFAAVEAAGGVEALAKKMLPMADQQLPPPKFVYVAPWPLMLTHVGLEPGIPVEPPVELEGGQAIELWWCMEAGELRYHHAGSKRAP